MSDTSSKPIISLDIGPMSEKAHTGIANVAKFLAMELLGDDDVDCMFTFNRQVISKRVVENLTALSGGDILWWIAGRAVSEPLTPDFLDRRVIGIYPGHKWHRRFFPFEVQIVHDLTAILLPQYHTEESVAFWQASLLGDMASSDLIATVSESTAMDVRTYYPELNHIPVVVSHLASCCDAVPQVAANAPPYIVVLGTLEPRKNILPILEFLAVNPAILERLSFIFVGRVGWGEPIQNHVERFGIQNWIDNGRIRFTGFVGDRVRDYLMANAQGVIYPSLYEGFGLPVLEALGLGVPVITTTHGSLPEAGGPQAIYCDFSDPADIAASINMLLEAPSDLAATQAQIGRRAWAQSFSWADTYKRIRDAAISEYDRKHHGQSVPHQGNRSKLGVSDFLPMSGQD